MKLAFGLTWMTIMAVTTSCVNGAPQAGPPPLPEESLVPQCRTPKCPDNKNSKLPYPLDCLLYVECNEGVGKVTACPPDTRFNEADGICTDSETANCVDCWEKLSTR